MLALSRSVLINANRVAFFSTSSSARSAIVQATDATLSEELKSKQPVIVDFYAEYHTTTSCFDRICSWCGPCRMLAPILSKIAADGSAKVIKINVDDNSESASTYKVSALPTVVGFMNGRETGRFVGLKDEKGVRAFVASLKQ